MSEVLVLVTDTTPQQRLEAHEICSAPKRFEIHVKPDLDGGRMVFTGRSVLGKLSMIVDAKDQMAPRTCP